MATKIRVYELARELGKDNKEMQKIVRGLGFTIKNYMSTLTVEQADHVRRQVRGGGGGGGGGGAPPPKRRAKTPSVLRRAAKRPRPAEREREAAAREAAAREEREREAQEVAARSVRPRIVSGPTIRRSESRRNTSNERESSGAPVRRRVSDGHANEGAVNETHKPSVTPEVDQVVRSDTSLSSQRRMHEMADLDESSGESRASERRRPAVGTRIELPPNTRRFRGGMRERMQKAEQAAQTVPRGPAAPPSTSARESAPSAPAREERAPRTRPPAQAKAAVEDTGSNSSSSGRRVLRNESGVIVGVEKRRSGPLIKGFIQIQQPRARQQVIITDANEEPQRGRASQRKQREERIQQQGRKRKMAPRGMRGRSAREPSRVTTQEMSEAKKRIRVDEVIQIADLAHQMGKKAGAVMRVLWGMGLRGLTINNAIDFETAELAANEFGYTAENVAFQEENLVGQSERGDEIPRAPVVTMMGHVDHGKTSLLDKIRSTRVAAGESGGITQHIGAYKVNTDNGDVVFLDTPGHEAFSAMRSRGAHVTDVVVLVVAADDGVMPTTIEAIKHANEAGSPIIVALNKIDKPDANPGRVKQMLMEHGLVGEEFGGDTIVVEVSAKTGQGIDKLLEMLALQTEMLDLKASSEGRAEGVVLEARVDKGRGPIATVLVRQGMLHKGEIMVANEYSGKVRAMLNDRGKPLKEVGPSTPVEVLGLDGVPSAGDRFNIVENEKAAKQLISHRREQRRRKESVVSGPSIRDLIKRKKTTTLKVVLRADVDGSAEALKEALLELSTEKVKVDVIFSGVGAITQTDVKKASAGDAVIIGFNTKPVGKAGQDAEAEQVDIFTFGVIYDALDKTRELMIGLLEPEYREREQGEAEVRALFPIPRLGVVAGCRVVKGLVTRHSNVRVMRQGKMIHKGSIGSLRVFKDDVKEVREGFECGIVIRDFSEVEPGDILQAFELETIPPTL